MQNRIRPSTAPGSTPHQGVRLAPLLTLAVAILYALGGWLALTLGPAQSRAFLLSYVLVSSLALVPFYLWLLKRKRPPLSPRLGALLVFLATLVTPSLLQTDQLRYVWDGVMLGRGENPFALSPAEGLAREARLMVPGEVLSPAGLPVPDAWARSINHSHLPTVYPPLAQGAFALSSFLNPFFSIPAVNELFPAWMTLWPTLIWWPWELGWRLVVGTALAALVLLLARRRWDLVVFHPLVFLTGFANLHIDALMLPFLALCFLPINRRQPLSSPSSETKGRGLPPGVLLGLAALTRWTPLLLLPAFVESWRKRGGWTHALLGLASLASTIAIGLALFLPGSNGRLFESSATYAEHWYFFGFAHRLLADLLIGFGFEHEGIQVAKAILFSVWGLFMVWLVWVSRRRQWSLSLTTLILLTSFLIVMPTLHPWYFLPLLVLGVCHMRVLVTPWLWPLLAPLSYTFYFDSSDPLFVRLGVYAVVTVALIRDAVFIQRSGGHRRQSEREAHKGKDPCPPCHA